MRSTWQAGILGLIGLCVVGCSSEGIESPEPQPSPTGTAAGIWYGQSSTGRTVLGAVAQDGHYWFWQSRIGNSAFHEGVFFGQADIGDGTFASSNALDAGYDPFISYDWFERGTVTGTQVERSRLQGRFTGEDGSVATFALQYDAESDRTASLANIGGTYPGVSNTSVPVTAKLIVTATGEIRVEGACHSIIIPPPLMMRCDVTGTVTPRTTENLYDVVIREPIGFPIPTSLFREYLGIAMVDQDNGNLFVLASREFDGRAISPFFVYVGRKQP